MHLGRESPVFAVVAQQHAVEELLLARGKLRHEVLHVEAISASPPVVAGGLSAAWVSCSRRRRRNSPRWCLSTSKRAMAARYLPSPLPFSGWNRSSRYPSSADQPEPDPGGDLIDQVSHRGPDRPAYSGSASPDERGTWRVFRPPGRIVAQLGTGRPVPGHRLLQIGRNRDGRCVAAGSDLRLQPLPGDR